MPFKRFQTCHLKGVWNSCILEYWNSGSDQGECQVARLFNLPKLQLLCENAKKGDEFLNPGIGTWLNDRNSSVAKKLFLNSPLFSDVTFYRECLHTSWYCAVDVM